ncbi:MAG: hypothetical protein AAGC97_06330 [Planctomycetota bacterium]
MSRRILTPTENASQDKGNQTNQSSGDLVKKDSPSTPSSARRTKPAPASNSVEVAKKKPTTTEVQPPTEGVAKKPTAPPAVAPKPVAAPEKTTTPEPQELAQSPAPQSVATPTPSPAPESVPAPKPVPAPAARLGAAVTTPLAAAAQPQTQSNASTRPNLGSPVPKLPAKTVGNRDESLATQATTPPANTIASGKMATFGGSRPVDRPQGHLAPADRIELQAISDRLPVTVPGTPQGALHNAMNTSHDGFMSRSFAGTSNSHPSTQVPSMSTQPASPAPRTQPMPSYGQQVPLQAQQTPAYTQPMPAPAQAAPAFGQPGIAPNQMRPATPAAPMAAAEPIANESEVRAASELPGIRVVAEGPDQVMLRQTHTYEIRAENRGSVAADGLKIRAHIPDWADVVGQKTSLGDISGETQGTTRLLHWNLGRLDAGQTERLFVRLKAARSGTHDLDVDWTLQPQKKVVKVHVQEPKLALTIDGPDEVIYGESRNYVIRVLNPGDGVAPSVVFTLSPDSSTPQSQRIGDIPSGKEAQFEVELTAQDLGELKIHGLAAGDLELRAEADKTVRVLAADLEAVLTGPELKYQDTRATYQLQLSNNGTAASENVIATLRLPKGVQYIGGLDGASLVDNQLQWKVASLTPHATRRYQFDCMMQTTGSQQFVFQCAGSAAGKTSVDLSTQVEAIADLVLSIEDPIAPAPIGENVDYEIVIRNRGSKPATDVKAVAQFSHGIEPTALKGHTGKLVVGQVFIDPIERIDAGEEVRMTIVARAETGGHHRFRTEVRSGEAALVAEEATRFLAPSTERISRRSGPGGNEFSLPLR